LGIPFNQAVADQDGALSLGGDPGVVRDDDQGGIAVTVKL
jgi:hypothetical protein